MGSYLSLILLLLTFNLFSTTKLMLMDVYWNVYWMLGTPIGYYYKLAKWKKKKKTNLVFSLNFPIS